MKKLFLITLLLGGLGMWTAPGCIVRTRPAHTHHNVHKHPKAKRHHHKRHKRARCARGAHWNGHKCVHGGGRKY
ncbi:hypothetical protein [Haliangium ochraceum]|uniref:Uncharacterized protein n=1 Tax=Haliangium ochraceum (strain DSM 14365 / JCM 11303 / SMP-2) TaxID=502025 RepID=D0LXE9_HALO1|nr:hypothetical protein [Haliangium ochraceum]ACY17704.1 hypothetical protein Hoch_5218 [Haliangium ochraceum DSM 14365]